MSEDEALVSQTTPDDGWGGALRISEGTGASYSIQTGYVRNVFAVQAQCRPIRFEDQADKVLDLNKEQ